MIRFQVTAAASPDPITSIASLESPISTMPPIVSATAAPTTNGPRRLNAEAKTIACSGVAARVATSVAFALAASCSPLVTAHATASEIAITSPASTRRL